MQAISLEAASVLTGRSRSTLWRRVSGGGLTKLAANGKRAMVELKEVLPLIGVDLPADDIELIIQADAGDVDAQVDMGQFFLQAGKPKVAVYWLRQAAHRGHPDSMQSLAQCYASGSGVDQDLNMALMWLAKAAANGHKIAMAQMDAIRSPALNAFGPRPN